MHIKRFLVILSVLLLCLLTTAGAFVLALRSARVQTALVGALTDELSRTLQADIRIEEVDIRPSLAIRLKNVYLSDQTGDTLLFVPAMKVRINPFELANDRISFPIIQIDHPNIHIKQDSTSSNYDFLIRAFRSDKPKKPLQYEVDCKQIVLDSARVHFQHLPSQTDVVFSDIQTDLGFLYEGKNAISATLRSLHMKACLLPIQGYMEADLHGSLDTLFADQLKVVYHDQQLFDGNVQVNNPLKKDFLSARLSCTDVFANSAILSSLISDLQHQPVAMPPLLAQLGNVHYRGVAEGTLKKMKLHGAFLTQIGSVTTNVQLLDLHQLEGQIITRNMALGKLLHNTDLGLFSATLSVDASLQKPLAVKAHGSIARFEYKDYLYSNIQLSGQYDSNQCLAKMQIDDPHVVAMLNAQMTGLSTAPVLNMDVRIPQLDLAELHLTDSTLQNSLSLHADIQLQTDLNAGNLVDGTVGRIDLDSIRLYGAGQEMKIPSMEIVASSQQGKRHMYIESSVLTANVDGHFQWSSIPATIKRFLHHSLPSMVANPRVHGYANDMDFKIELLRANDLLRVLSSSKLSFSSVPVIEGFIHESDSVFSISMRSPEVVRNNTAYQNFVLSLDNNNPQRDASGTFSIMQHTISQDSARLRVGDVMAEVRLVAHRDTLTTALEFGPVESIDQYPDILVQTTFAQHNNAPLINIHVLPTAFELGSEDWHVMESNIRYAAAEQNLTIEQLKFFTRHQMLMINGRMSKSLNDSLTIQMRDVDLGYLLSSTRVLDALDLSGQMTGWCTLYGAFSSPQFEANVTIPNAQINGTDLGQVTARAELDRQTGDVMIAGKAVRDSLPIADVTGRVVTKKPASWFINIDANGAPLTFINYWTSGLLDQIEGEAYGRVHIFGRNRRTWVLTRAYAKDAALTIPYTGCRYFFSDSIIMDTTSITLPAVHIRDAEGHQGLVSGRINHRNFTNFNYKISAQCNNLMGINLPASSQSAYYGKVYATGKVDISGDSYQTLIDVNASTTGNSDFYLSLATASSASSSEFITFRDPNAEPEDTTEQTITYKPSSHLMLNLAVEVLPTAKVHLVLDEHNGDGIVGRGEGNLRMYMDASTGDIQLLGTYSLLGGTFSYTVGNLVHRDFAIAEGSTVTWSGNAANPQLDIKAKYRCTASLRDLFGADVKSVTSRPSIPVDCVVHITGELNNMILHFGIEYPQSDESVAAQINAVINTEAMLMRQVIYLLVFNRFYTPDYMRTSNSAAGLNDAYSLLSSTVTGQINSWLSKLTSMVNVGFNMRTDGAVGNQSYETEANIQIQPIDRLTINGNVGYRYNDLTNQPIFGDADVEYELTADGKLRAKVFTHSVDQYSLHQSGMQEGIGFIFRHDFNPGDAKKRRETKRAAKEQKAAKR